MEEISSEFGKPIGGSRHVSTRADGQEVYDGAPHLKNPDFAGWLQKEREGMLSRALLVPGNSKEIWRISELTDDALAQELGVIPWPTKKSEGQIEPETKAT